ncbi:hypothetical protein KEM52_002587 [Ascosphaera acerosa]|nr:hypothetical protein KEM52_002587 [Ascosphaera acerosa]
MVTMEHPVAHASDKKRNKLGYHRTSVACSEWFEVCKGPRPQNAAGKRENLTDNQASSALAAHCRRRKIRCVPSGSSGRCENCIRLKKECRFHPVDQQPPSDRKGHGTSKPGEGGRLPKPAIVPSSPPHTGPLGQDEYLQYAPITFDPSHELNLSSDSNFVRPPTSPYHGTGSVFLVEQGRGGPGCATAVAKAKTGSSIDTSSMANLSGVPSPVNQQAPWGSDASVFDHSIKRERLQDHVWIQQHPTTSPSDTPSMPPPPIPEENPPVEAALSTHTQSPIWSPPAYPQIARAISYESVPLYANPMQAPLRRMTNPSVPELFQHDLYHSPPSIPENQPAPASPASYGMEPLSLNHYASFGSFVEQPEMLSPPYTTTPPGMQSTEPPLVPCEMPQTQWLDPNLQYGASPAYSHRSPPL